MSPKASVPTQVWVAPDKRRIGVPHDGSKVPGFSEWLSAQEGSTKHARSMAAGKGRAQLEAILKTAPELGALYREGLAVLHGYDRREAGNWLPARYTTAYKDLEHQIRRTETFCSGVVNALTLGITEPWAIKTYAFERVAEFDRRRRRRTRVRSEGGQQRNILALAHKLIENRLADDYASLRRVLGLRLKGDVSDSNITKVLEHYSEQLGGQYGHRFAPKSRRG